jgi:hypothetical protein
LPGADFKTLGKDKKILCLFLYNNLNKHLSRDDFNGEHLICRLTELIIGDGDTAHTRGSCHVSELTATIRMYLL